MSAGIAISLLLLARRQTEPAILRTLGMHRNKAAAVFFAEQAILCLVGTGLAAAISLLWGEPCLVRLLPLFVFLAGYLIGAGLDQTITTESVGGQGFTAIMVAWLAKFNPVGMIITSALIQVLNQGAAQISQDFNVSSAFPDVIVGIILFFIIGSEFFINYRIHFRGRTGHEKVEMEGVK